MSLAPTLSLIATLSSRVGAPAPDAQIGITAEREPALVPCPVIKQPEYLDCGYPGASLPLSRLPNRRAAHLPLG